VQTQVFTTISNPFAGPGGLALKQGALIGVLGADWYDRFILQQLVPEQSGLWRMAPLPRFAAGGSSTSIWGGSSFSVAKSSPVADAALQLLKDSVLTEEGQIHKFTQVNFKPTWLSVYQAPAVQNATDAFMKGQVLGRLYGELAPEAPIIHQSPHWNDALNLLQDAVLDALAGRKSSKDAIAGAASALKTKVQQSS